MSDAQGGNNGVDNNTKSVTGNIGGISNNNINAESNTTNDQSVR